MGELYNEEVRTLESIESHAKNLFTTVVKGDKLGVSPIAFLASVIKAASEVVLENYLVETKEYFDNHE